MAACRYAELTYYSLLLLLLFGQPTATRRLKQSPPSDSNEQAVLLTFADKLTNFQAVAKKNLLRGWTANSSSPCSGTIQVERDAARECDPENTVYKSADRNPWTGVTCNSAGRVSCITLDDLQFQGPIASIAALSGLRDLAFLNLKNNRLSGSLPADLGNNLNTVLLLHLEGNAINGSLPTAWGTQDGFSDLQVLHLHRNILKGSLPSEWGQSGRWSSLQELALGYNNLGGTVPDTYSQGNGSWPALQQAVLTPGNRFCGVPPPRFPALNIVGTYVSGAVFTNITRFNITCNNVDGVLVPSASSSFGPSLGSDLKEPVVAGIVAGEIALGLLLLVISGIFHRRYRWRQERSWVLFDWDVVQEPKTPRQFFPRHLPHWLHMSGSGRSEADSGNGSKGNLFSPTNSGNWLAGLLSSEGRRNSAEAAKNGENGQANGSMKRLSLPIQAWREVLFEPHEIRLQQNADGSLKHLGNGSFGKVFKGVCQEHTECAVKIFEGYTGEQERELLLQEISILRSCRNTNVVQFYGVCLQKDDVWMVMELMQGNLFRHLARGHHCTWYFRGRSIALDIARGMHYLHERNIIHMDLKSPNILIGETGIAKVADVGLARVMGSDSFVNQMCAGTMHWMAPEVLLYGTCTEKADIFSFGVILWEICTGEAPTRGRMTCVSVPDECPQDVADLIELCMDEAPLKRPSASDIINRIQGIPITTRPVPSPPWYAR